MTEIQTFQLDGFQLDDFCDSIEEKINLFSEEKRKYVLDKLYKHLITNSDYGLLTFFNEDILKLDHSKFFTIDEKTNDFYYSNLQYLLYYFDNNLKVMPNFSYVGGNIKSHNMEEFQRKAVWCIRLICEYGNLYNLLNYFFTANYLKSEFIYGITRQQSKEKIDANLVLNLSNLIKFHSIAYDNQKRNGVI